jgi:hypothetical protein
LALARIVQRNVGLTNRQEFDRDRPPGLTIRRLRIPRTAVEIGGRPGPRRDAEIGIIRGAAAREDGR